MLCRHWPLSLALVLAPLAAAVADSDAVFTPTDCWFEVPRDREIACGSLSVPEDRSDKASKRRVRLPVVVIEPERERHPPVVFLSGGPGQSNAIENSDDILWWLDYYDREDWLRGRRLILADQRGTGLADPPLPCPELTDPYGWGGVLRSLEEAPAADWAGPTPPQLCAQALIDRGIPLSAYNTAASAADYQALRQALGIERWVLFGVSYGTRLALTLLRDDPEGVAAAVLDSVQPLEVDPIAEAGRALDEALHLLQRRCDEDGRCAAEFGDLLGKVEATAARFDAAPLPLRLPSDDGTPAYVLLDGGAYLSILFNALYDWHSIERLPLAIDRIDRQDYRFLAEWAAEYFLEPTDISYGLFLSVGCREDRPFTDEAALAATAKRYPYLEDWVASDFLLGVCADWPVDPGPSEDNAAVTSEAPVLLLSGEFDPVTPAYWAAQTLTNLPNGHHLVLRGIGHDVVGSSNCATEVVADFLADPATPPQTPCLELQEGPDFVLDPSDW